MKVLKRLENLNLQYTLLLLIQQATEFLQDELYDLQYTLLLLIHWETEKPLTVAIDLQYTLLLLIHIYHSYL